MNDKDYIYSENHVYSLACRLRSKLRDESEENPTNETKDNYLVGSYAEKVYAPQYEDDMRVMLMIKAWRYAILLNESKDFPPEVREEIKKKVKAFVDSYEILFGKKGEDDED